MSKIADSKTLLTYGLIAGGGYLLYKTWGLFSTAPNPLEPVGNAISSFVDSILNPNAAGSAVTYTVQMPDGTYAAVNSNSVNALGQTTIGGATYQINTDSSITSGVNKTAVPIDLGTMTSTTDDMDFSAGNF